MKRILIVDDEQAVLDILQEVLVYAGYDVIATTECIDATTLINNHNPDLILIDYLLNKINGGEICHQIKSNPLTNHIPVILMSAYPKVLKSLGDYGCDTFIEKPFDLNVLLTEIGRCFKKDEYLSKSE